MKTITPRRAVPACLLLAALALPARAAATLPPPAAAILPPRAAANGCPAQSTAQRFLRWGDLGQYAPVPDSGFETGTGWTLGGGAAIVNGNEPFFIGSPTDTHSLSLPAGGSAASAPMCLWLGSPTLRLLVRNQGDPTARLTVAATLTDAAGIRRTVPLAYLTGSAQWAPSPPIVVLVNAVSVLQSEQVSFSFAPADDGGQWTIDDVYVDPYGKG